MGADGFILLYSGGSHDGEKSAVHGTKLSVDGTFHPSRNWEHATKNVPTSLHFTPASLRHNLCHTPSG